MENSVDPDQLAGFYFKKFICGISKVRAKYQQSKG